ncbi:hypothetical protein DSM21852_08040 [Methylocystis bryophila]|nr:hypothetical protein DSM21852_08040 [Methylocystis bryophila]
MKDPNLQNTFRKASARCEAGEKELEREITKLGGSTTDSGSVAGAVHRAWIDLKSAVTGGDEKAILEECERGEDVAKAAYEKALKAELAPEVIALVQKQYAGVLENHDLIKRLRDTAH